MLTTCDRKACDLTTDMPDSEWLYVTQGEGLFQEKWTFCSWQCMSMYATEYRPSFM